MRYMVIENTLSPEIHDQSPEKRKSTSWIKPKSKVAKLSAAALIPARHLFDLPRDLIETVLQFVSFKYFFLKEFRAWNKSCLEYSHQYIKNLRLHSNRVEWNLMKGSPNFRSLSDISINLDTVNVDKNSMALNWLMGMVRKDQCMSLERLRIYGKSVSICCGKAQIMQSLRNIDALLQLLSQISTPSLHHLVIDSEIQSLHNVVRLVTTNRAQPFKHLTFQAHSISEHTVMELFHELNRIPILQFLEFGNVNKLRVDSLFKYYSNSLDSPLGDIVINTSRVVGSEREIRNLVHALGSRLEAGKECHFMFLCKRHSVSAREVAFQWGHVSVFTCGFCQSGMKLHEIGTCSKVCQVQIRILDIQSTSK